MAIKTFVTGSSTATIADNDTTIVGGTAGNEKVKILSGVTGTNLDGNIEKVDLAGSLADYKFVFVAGSGFQVQTTSGAVVTTIASLNQADKRVKYLIFQGKIWSAERASEGDRDYDGSNKHNKHLHISIKDGCGDDTSPWFPWLGKPKAVNKVRAAVKPLPKKKENQ